MRRTAFDSARDQRIADEMGIDRALMCCATGCPNRWSCDPPRACRWHAGAEPHLWPQITQEQLDAEADRALAAAAKIGHPEAPRLTRADKVAILDRLRSITMGSSNASPKAWANKLRERERNGERLTSVQKAAWRQALHVVAVSHEFEGVLS